MNRTAMALTALTLAFSGAAHAQDAPPPAAAPADAAAPDAALEPDPLAALQAEVASLRAREDIRELIHAYGRTIDTRDFAAFAALWTDDAEYVGGGNGAPVIGARAIGEFMADIIARNPSGLGEPNAHVFFNETIVVDGDRATGTSMSAFVTTAPDGPVMSIVARYEDEYVREDGGWKFARRAVRPIAN